VVGLKGDVDEGLGLGPPQWPQGEGQVEVWWVVSEQLEQGGKRGVEEAVGVDVLLQSNMSEMCVRLRLRLRDRLSSWESFMRGNMICSSGRLWSSGIPPGVGISAVAKAPGGGSLAHRLRRCLDIPSWTPLGSTFLGSCNLFGSLPVDQMPSRFRPRPVSGARSTGRWSGGWRK
jgi:hypothetical protein